MTNQKTLTVEDGWWVPASEFFKQKLLPITGSTQRVLDKNLKECKALILSGRDGWHDMNYQPISVLYWLKPKKWFANRQDTIGFPDKLAAYKEARPNSILR